MKKLLLHTPVGVRDVYGRELAAKKIIENRINDIFKLYGYHNIETPTFEFFDVFSEERGSVASRELYKFFDREGNTLVLRPDITPAIARVAAKYYADEISPIRFCYNENTFINDSEFQGKLKEFTQLGCELINDDSIYADAEMIVLAVNSLKASGLNDYLVEIGDVEFYKALLSECNISDDMEMELRERIENKNFFGVGELLDEIGVSKKLKEAFLTLPQLFGSKEIIEKAREVAVNKQARTAINKLEKLYDLLEMYGVAKYVSFDLGMLGNYNYYTGIIFKGYTYGSGNKILSGGRYNNLISQFGKNAPAVGFSIFVERILFAMSGESKLAEEDYKTTLVVCHEDAIEDGIEYVNKSRDNGIKTELVVISSDDEFDDIVNNRSDNCADNIIKISNNRR